MLLFILLISLVRENILVVLVFEYQGVPPPNDGVHCITSAVYFYLRSIFTAKSSLFILLISLVRENIPGGISI